SGRRCSLPVCFLFNHPATPTISTLSLHDAFRSQILSVVAALLKGNTGDACTAATRTFLFMSILLRVSLDLRLQLLQHRDKVLPKPIGVFRHRKVAEAFHDAEPGTGDALGQAPGRGGRRGVIVLPREQIERATGGVHLGADDGSVPFPAVEMQVSLVNAPPALAVQPPAAAAVKLGTGGTHQTVG